MLPLFQDNFILVKATFSHFFRVTTSIQQLLFRGSYFFRTAANFSFFRTITFLQKLFLQNSFFLKRKFYRAETCWEQEVIYGNYFLEQLLLLEELLKTKICTKELLFRSKYFCTASTFSETPRISEKLMNFRITYFWRAIFLEQILFQNMLPFQKSHFFTFLIYSLVIMKTQCSLTAV